MIKTRIFQIVGHIHNMQLCIEMISFINHENESILRWFYRFCEPRNFSLCPRNLVGVYSGGLGVWFMTFCCCLVEFGFSCFNHASIESWFANYSVLDILHTPLRSARCFSRRHRRALEKQGQKKQTKHSKQQDNTSMTVTVLVPGIGLFGLFNFGNYCSNSSINFAIRFVCFF